VVRNAAGQDVLLTPNGLEESVTVDNCEEFMALAIECRMNECKAALSAVSDGFWENFSMRPPKFLDWPVLEYGACGEKEVPTEALKKVTTFQEGFPDDQRNIFWNVVQTFSNTQRSLLLKFATGRSRLPVGVRKGAILRIDFLLGECDRMPTASTCFAKLHLPRYSSMERARKLISLAIEYTGTFEMG
jgi:hypothetical protein